MKQYFIEFEHTSSHLGTGGIGYMLVNATSFDEACEKIKEFSVRKCNPHHRPEPYYWDEYFRDAKNFINLTIE